MNLDLHRFLWIGNAPTSKPPIQPPWREDPIGTQKLGPFLDQSTEPTGCLPFLRPTWTHFSWGFTLPAQHSPPTGTRTWHMPVEIAHEEGRFRPYVQYKTRLNEDRRPWELFRLVKVAPVLGKVSGLIPGVFSEVRPPARLVGGRPFLTS